MIDKEKLKWTEEDDRAVEEYKRKVEAGEVTLISFDTFCALVGNPKKPMMKSYCRDRHNTLQSRMIEVCCKELAKTSLEYICNTDGVWRAGSEGQNHYQMKFCPFCGSKLP
mgnify:CR=1 FL=1